MPQQQNARRSTFLPFSPPSITDAEIAATVAALESGWLSTGPRVSELEARFAARVDAPDALAVASCTGGLHIALAAIGAGAGDAVFVPTMTFCATANVVEHERATPILVDCDPVTLNLDPVALEAAIANVPDGLRPRAVMPVHFAGLPCAMPAIEAIAREHGLAVIEDAAHALPAAVGDRTVGTVPDDGLERAVAFSFYATKNMTTGEGGMLTASPGLLEESRLWCHHGMSRDAWKRYDEGGSWAYDVVRPGYKYNMSDLMAAIGLVQLDRLDAMQARRREIVAAYHAALGDVDALELPVEQAGMTHAWHLFAIRLRLDRLAIDRAQFISELRERNIAASVHFIPVHLYSWYRDRYQLDPADFPVASREYERLVSIPLHPGLSDEDVDDVVAAIRDVCATHAR